ncbi:excisionase family DNA-binding protein [Vannielia litorea]|uniref:excisionase family DNA-binding protein n=1 Tax=Vannielia litorea TaxID=1217970 RepID=UPI001FD05394|nr:helix-turn-helix domain-containing protein [Vannielia litorea]MBS8227213.1 helix-turn-helix domain-containing protein [Vannielia litorea]
MSDKKPYSCQTLAERWSCSPETVRQMTRNGALPSFRLGKMIRIPAEAVVEHEACNNTPSSVSAEVSRLSRLRAGSGDGIVLRHAIERRPKPKCATSRPRSDGPQAA